PAGVRSCVRHRDRSAGIPVVGRELVFDRVSGAAHPGPLRVSALDHEVRDHAVEDRSIVEALPDELPEVARRDWHRLVEEFDLHIAHRRLQEDGRHAAAILSSYVKGRPMDPDRLLPPVRTGLTTEEVLGFAVRSNASAGPERGAREGATDAALFASAFAARARRPRPPRGRRTQT